MTFASHRPEADPRAEIRDRMETVRADTLALVADLGASELRAQADPDFSPLGWHLGHIAFIECRWLLRDCPDAPKPDAEAFRLWDANGLPRAARGAALPEPGELVAYAADIRTRTLAHLENRPLNGEARLWRWVAQHEAMHIETMSFVRSLLADRETAPLPDGVARSGDMLDIPAGRFRMGNDHPDAFDNEGASHWIDLAAYRIGRHPVTQGEYAAFMAVGGYDCPDYWSPAGWEWRRRHDVARPLHWRAGLDNHPVCGASWYEAEAYCRFAGKRLPTEAEWDKAACWDAKAGRARTHSWGEAAPSAATANFGGRLGWTSPVGSHSDGRGAYGLEDCQGNVWEWTASDFASYPGFSAYPYEAYSRPYFDGQHKALRGGSWATRASVLRSSFRNWYPPCTRQILAGFRCADDGPK
ncbi:MAG: SUMF1/EgtB/PvdO family nonheme iron enzyme [Alphaproteobacteria bacterium]